MTPDRFRQNPRRFWRSHAEVGIAKSIGTGSLWARGAAVWAIVLCAAASARGEGFRVFEDAPRRSRQPPFVGEDGPAGCGIVDLDCLDPWSWSGRSGLAPTDESEMSANDESAEAKRCVLVQCVTGVAGPEERPPRLFTTPVTLWTGAALLGESWTASRAPSRTESTLFT